MVAISNILVLAGIAFYLSCRFEKSLRVFFWPGLMIKMLAGVCVGLVYQYYYSSGDTFMFFQESLWLADYFMDNPIGYVQSLWNESNLPEGHALTISQPRSLFFVKLVSVFTIISGKNYWITSLYLSLISFIGSFWFFSLVIKKLNVSMWMAAIALLFFPSVVFWSSGIIKESVAMAALFILSGYFIKKMTGDRMPIRGWIIVALCLWIMWSLKYYWTALFIPIALTSLLLNEAKKYAKLSAVKVALLWVSMYVVITVSISFLHPNFYLNRLLDVIVQNNYAYTSISESNDLIQFYNLQPFWTHVIINSPWALVSGLFRPFVWEFDSVFKLAISLEGIVLFVLMVGQLHNPKRLMQSTNRLMLFSVLCYSILLCTFLALSTPNLGSLSRYKVGFMPFLLLILFADNPLLQLFRKRFFSTNA